MTDLIHMLIKTGIELVRQHPNKTQQLEQINTKDQHSIEIDVLLETAFIEVIKSANIKANIYSEEIGLITIHDNPDFLIAFDPLDGSTNYKLGKNTLPFGSLFAIFSMPAPTFSTVVASGAVEYTSGDYWVYDGKITKNQQGKTIEIVDFEISPSTPIYIDLHFRQKFELYTEVSKQLFIRNEGATIGNLRHVLNGVSGALVMSSMKPEEVGAVVSLIKGSQGGVVSDFSGQEVGVQSFETNRGYEIIAGSPTVAVTVSQYINH